MNNRLLSALSICALAGCLLTGCEKKESAITLPPQQTNALPGRVNMGAGYETQIFYDIESNSVVATSEVKSWDLAFEAGSDGYHAWMNGGKGVSVINTHKVTFGPVQVPAGTTWGFDDPSGHPDSTAVGDWRDRAAGSRMEVYIAKLGDNDYRQFRLLSADEHAYVMEWAGQDGADVHTVTMPKNDAYNYIYFSFDKGIVKPEPPKADWDIVFTRYRYIYRDLDNFPYEVNGALLNPSRTTAARDSVDAFADISIDIADQLKQTSARDAIGFQWKRYNFNSGRYEVNRNYSFVVSTRNGQLHKLHFLDFYSAGGAPGSPSFETLRLR